MSPEQGARCAAPLERVADSYLSREDSVITGGDRCTLQRCTDINTRQADGGATRLENLLLLSRHHHRLVYEGACGPVLDAGED